MENKTGVEEPEAEVQIFVEEAEIVTDGVNKGFIATLVAPSGLVHPLTVTVTL